jgi:hypothetical protein
MVKIKLRILVAYFLLFHVPRYCERELFLSLIIIPVRLFISHFHSVKVIHSIQILCTFVLILYEMVVLKFVFKVYFLSLFFLAIR